MIHVLVMNVSLVEGMAGSMRVKHLLTPLVEKSKVELSNLVLTQDIEKHKIGSQGILNNMPYLYIGYKSFFNIGNVIKFFRTGFGFIHKGYKANSKNIMYIYGYPDLKNILFILRARRIGYKIVFDIVEDNRFTSNFKSFLGWLRNKSSVYLLNRTPKIANGVIAISKHLEKRMEAICKGKIPVLHTPVVVNLNRFGVVQKGNSQFYTIFYGGSFAEKDGLSFLIDAFNIVKKNNKNVQLVLTGKPSSNTDMSKIKLHSEGINYKGFLSEDDYYKELNNADIFCMTRINSPFANAGFPFKLGEFLATGKAVIATEVGDVSDYIKNHINGILIMPESIDDISKSIEYFISNPEKITEMGVEARKTAIQYFGSEKLSQEVFSYFNNLA